jgi:hypothetical protein
LTPDAVPGDAELGFFHVEQVGLKIDIGDFAVRQLSKVGNRDR